MAVSLTNDNLDLAGEYDKISETQYNNGCLLIEKLQVKPGDSVLDIGSGTGRLGRYVLNIIGKSGRYVGIDPLSDRVKISVEKNKDPNANFRIGTAEDLGPIPENSVDVVYLNAVFHWVLDKELALQNILRVLTSGGKVGITTGAKELNKLTKMRRTIDSVLMQEPYCNSVNIEESTLNQHGLTTTELILLLRNAGFSIIEVCVKPVAMNFLTVDAAIRHSEASSFGNYLNHVPEVLRNQAKQDITAELEKYYGQNGIQYHNYTVFAIAQKGAASAGNDSLPLE